MESYIHLNESIYAKVNQRVEEALAIITNRYIGQNPAHPMVYRAFSNDGLMRLKDYRYEFNFGERFPYCQNGQFIYAWGKLWQDEEAEFMFALNCYGPVHIYLNGEFVYRSTIVEELDPKKRVGFRFTLKKGWNHFVLRFEKTTSGIGGIFGTGSFKRHPMHVLSPTHEREGQEGWIFTEPLAQPLECLPEEGTASDVEWLPAMDWGQDQRRQLTRLFGSEVGQVAAAWTKLVVPYTSQQQVTLKGYAYGAMTLLINDQTVFETKEDQEIVVTLPLSYGEHDVTVICTCVSEQWGFELEPVQESVTFTLPYPVKGARESWLYLGSFATKEHVDLKEAKRLDTVVASTNGPTFWRLDQPNTWVRPYLENRLFGKWDYPLGVTLYGLIQTGKELERKDIINYTLQHIETSTSLYQYSLWDKEQYGAAGVNNQLSAIDSLDDCGSFGSTMLLATEIRDIRDANRIADDIAHYITNVQDRLSDGTLYRRFGSVSFMKDTIWCDDLYMSTPFLCRYYKKTGELSYLEDAANQFLHYKQLMYMPEEKIMSHVYDFKFDTATNVPWGRGNGWVLFSLSELLEVLPEDHSKRPALISFFRELCEGFLALQGEHGLWHQVLTDSTSYEETSCTSMFIYGFARGVRHGWLVDPKPYIEASIQGWEGMTRRAIDQYGNVYGVCQGSGYAFTISYYRDDLTWILNDTHGIGIVLLAGIELLKLKKSLHERNEVLVER
ncbi:glycoside hydrolase family 105 protein [Halalkalibacter sp. APA_J-10(15)]|uniref:glycoside hydrolase family 88/105 protein n=1 Tax=Halalkalibacter sp. APA_J-10(15) TaxID=2933805 RepID=UPI001FF31ED3|nr:glycoside hydrolase family 88 protein [Halalkalibacter sp. APA_J-10(15)]MCK0473594.1 glycoside hydrolase family 88 protein [Halalkalibacter sp. APA_J-10(15)]